MRIGGIYRDGTANAYYRAAVPLIELERRGHTVLWPHMHNYRTLLEGVPSWDLLHIHEFIGPGDLEVVQRLRSQGVAVVWDTDDDVLSVPKGSPSYRRLGGRRKIRHVFECCVDMARAAHLMTTTSERLATIYREAGVEHVTVIDNHLALSAVADGRRRRRPGLVIGCTAGSEHERDLGQLKIRAALKRLMRAHPQVSVVMLGVDLRLGGPRYAHVPRVPIGQLVDTVRDFDIALAPLVNTPFNGARSNVKLKEYAAGGVAWLASPVGPYRGMGEHQGGLLVPDGEWYDAIESLVLDVSRRAELARHGRAWAAGQTIRQGGGRWEAAFRSAVLRARRERA